MYMHFSRVYMQEGNYCPVVCVLSMLLADAKLISLKNVKKIITMGSVKWFLDFEASSEGRESGTGQKFIILPAQW